jgi:hypothetical protein
LAPAGDGVCAATGEVPITTKATSKNSPDLIDAVISFLPKPDFPKLNFQRRPRPPSPRVTSDTPDYFH